MELQEILKVLDFNEKDKENKNEIASILKNYGGEIENEAVYAFLKNPEVAKVIERSNTPFSEVKDGLLNLVEIIFSLEFDTEFEKKLPEFFKGLTKIGMMDPNFLPLGIFLFFIKLNDKILSLGLDSDLSKTLLKMASAFLVKGMGLYREELINLFLKFTGMSKELFERQIEVEAKKAKGNA